MKLYRAECASRGYLLGDRIELRDSFWGRGAGLMFRPSLGADEGLWLKNVPSIHMCFMRFPIDAVFIDENGVVVRTFSSLAPWTGFASARARDVLELPAGTVRGANCLVGDRITFTTSQIGG